MAKTEPNGKPITSWDKAIRPPCVAVILGFRRKGKSALAWFLVERLHKKLNLQACCVGLPKKHRKLLPKWVNHYDDITKLPKKSVVIVDEAGLRFAARRHNSDPNVVMQALIALSGQKEQVILFIAHVSRLLDVDTIMDSDLVIFKMPSLAHERFERREIAEFTKEARAQLLAKGNPKKWSYVVDFHEGGRGVLANTLPSFWTETLSHAWADLALEEVKLKKQGQTKKEKKNGGGTKS